MLEFCLLALPWVLDPNIVQQSRRDVATPIATCVRPAVMVVEPNIVCASSMPQIAETPSIETWLRRWENTTRNAPSKSRSQREEFRRRMHEDFNEHTVAAVEQLVGPVNENWLNETYNWRVLERTGERVCLEAIPKDETERLFYGSLRISLMADDGTLEQLIVVSRNHSHRTVWQSERPIKDERIQLVHFENGIPPAPNALLRTANSRLD